MREHIIFAQKSDMGFGSGEYLFNNLTLNDVLKWLKANLHDWGTITIKLRDGSILRKFDYDLYNNQQFYCHFSWEGCEKVNTITFIYCFMNRDIEIYLI